MRTFEPEQFDKKQSRIQPKLEIGQINDRYEQEADQTADRVMQMPETEIIQRKGQSFGEDVKMKPLSMATSPMVQMQTEGKKGETKSDNSKVDATTQDSFPYEAEIATMWNTPLYEEPDINSKRLDDLDRGTRIEVLSEHGSFFKISVKNKTGFVLKKMVAKSILKKIEDFEKMNYEAFWHESSMGLTEKADEKGSLRPIGKSSEFWKWALGEDYDEDKLTMSCWEFILQMGMETERISSSYVKKFYRTKAPKEIQKKIDSPDPKIQKEGKKEGKKWHDNLVVDALMADGSWQQEYDPTDPDKIPRAGDIIFFNGATHVAIATGKIVDGKTEVLSLWNRPGQDQTIDRIEKTTIEDLKPDVILSLNDPNAKVSITWAIPPWVDDNLK